MSATNIRQKPIKGRTIVTKFKNHANITLEKLAEEYGWETKKFFELLEKAVGSETFSELQKTARVICSLGLHPAFSHAESSSPIQCI